jgi:hypothetical protein
MVNIAIKYLFMAIVIYLFLPVAMAAVPTVNLTSPANNNVSHVNNMTFFCNVTDDINVSAVILYHDINGVFAANSTKRLMELESDSNTTLLCHFNNNYTCEDGEQGINSSTSFEPSIFMQGVLINEPGTLKYPTSGNIELSKGTIEMWVKVGFDTALGTFFLFDSGTLGVNKLSLYVSDGILNFDLIAAYGATSNSVVDIRSWSAGEWHHIAAVWNINYLPNGYITDIFINGSDAATVPYDDYEQVGGMEQYFYIGSDSSGTNWANSVFDELRLSNKPRNASEINESYNKGITSHASELVNFTLTNMPDGIYHWNCLAYDNDSQSAWGAQNFTIGIDTISPPIVNYITFSPNSTDDIDPGVTINVTANITDVTNVSEAIFQHKYDVDWINVSMTRNGDIWNASFTTIGSERTYYYRIFANDTLGNANTSANLSVNVTWDYTWTRSPANLTAYGLVNTISPVGILTLNNTGDDTIIFTLSDDWPIIDVYYNTTEQFSVPAKSFAYVNVTAKFAQADSTSNMTITISAEPSAPGKTASPTLLTTTAVMNSYSGGPYLDVNIVTMPASVMQSQSGVNISVTFKNTGNETAYNVTLNWSVPSGWVNISGSFNAFAGNITSQSTTNTSDVTVNIGSSAPSGISTICFNVTRSGNVSYAKCQNVQISCSNDDGVCGAGCVYTNDDDCSPPSTGGESTGGGGAGLPRNMSLSQQKYDIFLSNPLRADGYRNSTLSFSVNINNANKKTYIENIELIILGYPQGQIKTIPRILTNLSYEKNGSFLVELSIPVYMKYGLYNLSLKAVGTSKIAGSMENGTLVTAYSNIIIFVHSQDENDTINLLNTAESKLGEMKNLGIRTDNLENLINESKESLNNFDYEKSKELSEKIIETTGMAIQSSSLLKELMDKLNKSSRYSIESTESQKLYSLALSAFERGDYKRSQERATNALLTFGIEVGDKIVVAEFWEQNWKFVAGALILLAFISIFAHRYASIRLNKNKLKRLEQEEKSITILMKSLQNQFFEKEGISKSAYDDQMNKHEKRLARIKKEMADTDLKIKRLAGSYGLEKQKAHVINMIKETQKNHFEKDGTSKKVYKETVDELREELAEIERKSKTRRRFLVSVVLIFIILSGTVFAASDITNVQRTREAIQAAGLDIKEMQDAGFSIKRANDTLSEANIMFERGNHVNALSLAVYVGTIKDAAKSADELIDAVEAKIQDSEKLGINTSAAKELFKKGMDAFDSELYEDAKDFFEHSINILDEAENELMMKKAMETSEQDNIISFLGQQYKTILAVLLITLVALYIVYKATGPFRAKIKIARLKKEKEVAESQIKGIQTKYYELGKIPKSEYHLLLKNHMDRIEQIKKQIAMLSRKS